MAHKIKLFKIFAVFLMLQSALMAQDFLLQGWYWDYPKTTDNNLWADTLRLKAQELADAGFTHVWLPPLSRASFGNSSNGYDPKDLFDLGLPAGGGATGFGSVTDLQNLIAEFNAVGIKAVADVVYNHRDGGKPENNPAVEGWIEGMTDTKINSGDQPFPSDRFRIVLPIGGATGYGSGTYYFKIRSKSLHSNFDNFGYKLYIQSNRVGYRNLSELSEDEFNNGAFNGGGDCGQGNNATELGRDMLATIDNAGCGIDEFALTVTTDDFFAAGDTLFIFLNNTGGSYSDHTVHGLWYDNGSFGQDIVNSLIYQTYTNFFGLPSQMGGMNYLNFKPNGNSTQLSGDFDFMWFFYDYDQNVQNTKDVLFDWSKWLWTDNGIRGYRMDAVKHFDYAFAGDLLDYLYDQGIAPDLVVGEFFDGNPGTLKNWVDVVSANMDADTKTAITPRIFDFSLRSKLEAADVPAIDVREVFTSSMVDAVGASGFNVVTFVNNHDFRHGGEPVENDPILSYAYILTNNQIGLPTVFYTDYYHRGIKDEIDELISIHKAHIAGATQRDYLSNNGGYYRYYDSGYETNTLLYQLYGTPSGKDVMVAINFANIALRVTHGVNTFELPVGSKLFDLTGNATSNFMEVDGNSRVSFEIPARSYTVWLETDGIESTPPTATISEFSGTTASGTISDGGSGIVSIEVKTLEGATITIGGNDFAQGQRFNTSPVSSVSITATKTGTSPKARLLITDAAGNQRVWFVDFL